MSRRAWGFAATTMLALLAIAAMALAVAPPTPRIGTFDVKEPTFDGRPTGGTFVVAKSGKQQRKVQFAVSAPAKCTYGNGEISNRYKSASFVQKKFIPIKDGSLKVNGTSREPAAGGLLAVTTRGKVSGTFKTATKLVGEMTLVSTYVPSEANPEGPAIFPGGTMSCKTGKTAFTATYR